MLYVTVVLMLVYASFSIANAVWLENGGVYAVPNLWRWRIW
jgi:prolyl oligopeptidase PreP (S9A serine peptidase family)